MAIPVLPEDGWLEQHRGSPLPAVPLAQGCSLFSKYLRKKKKKTPKTSKNGLAGHREVGWVRVLQICKAGYCREMSVKSMLLVHTQTPPFFGN